MTTGLGWAGYCAGCQFCKACFLKISMDRNYVEDTINYKLFVRRSVNIGAILANALIRWISIALTDVDHITPLSLAGFIVSLQVMYDR